MPKLSKLQKLWVADHAGDDDHLSYLMSFLLKLKVFNKKQYISIKDEIHKTVYKWQRMEWERKAKHAASYDDRPTYGRAPKSIKPTRARS